MDFTKEAIDQVELTCKNKKYYYVSEVDELLNRLAADVENGQQELTKLRNVAQEYSLKKEALGDALLNVKTQAQEQAQREKARYAEELAALEREKTALAGEICILRQQKEAVLQECRKRFAAFLTEIDRDLSGEKTK